MANGQGFSAIVGSGTVAPSVFVHFCTATATGGSIAGYAVQQSVVSSVPCGIAQEGARYAPTEEQLGTYAGRLVAAGGPGDPIKVYALGDICLLSLGGTVTPGQLLRPDANGKGIAASVTGLGYGAMTQEGGNSGDLIRVQVVMGVY